MRRFALVGIGVSSLVLSLLVAAAVPTAAAAPARTPSSGVSAVTGHFESAARRPAARSDASESVQPLKPGSRSFNAAALVAAARTPSPVADDITVSTSGAAAQSDALKVSVAADDRAGSGMTLTLDGQTSARVALKVPTDALKGLYGADYASRLTWHQRAKDGSPLPDPKVNRSLASTTIHPDTSRSSIVYATSGPVDGDGNGNFTATPLSPSGSWSVNTQTGAFDWQYPLPAPPAANGPAPDVALAYDSGSVDGRTGLANNQPSDVGDGWQIAAGGFIERSYTACSADTTRDAPTASPNTPDNCWVSNNATVSLSGHSGHLLSSDGANWKLETDDGSRIQRLTGANNGAYQGEYWLVTTTDGTEYFFGLNDLSGRVWNSRTTGSAWTVPVVGNKAGEPCMDQTDHTCLNMAWRWNLDLVVDPSGNASAYYYDPETNLYGRNMTATKTSPYTRGGVLDHIDYGLRTDQLTTSVPEQIVFDHVDRCVTGCGQNANWYDTPLDQVCAASPCTDRYAPTFFSKYRLSGIRTQLVYGSTTDLVDTWTLNQGFPKPGDGTSPVLRLNSVTHVGSVGGTSAPLTTTYGYTNMPNRVYIVDGVALLWRFRLTSVVADTGAVLSINYLPASCTKDNLPTDAANAMFCYPQWWAPKYGDTTTSPRKDWFNKYAVQSVVHNSVVGGAAFDEHDYTYSAPAWRYDDWSLLPDVNTTDPALKDGPKRTWNDFAGFAYVQTRHGDHNYPNRQEITDDYYYQGLFGDRQGVSGGTRPTQVSAPFTTAVDDDGWLAGRTREEITYASPGVIAARTVTDPWWSQTLSAGGHQAYLTGDGTQTTYTALTGPTRPDRVTQTITTQEPPYGLITSVNDLGDLAVSTDDMCTTTSYDSNPQLWLINFESEIKVLSGACGQAQTAANTISDVSVMYDGATSPATVPTRGLITTTRSAQSVNAAGTPQWLTTSTAQYDAVGRAVQTIDALGHTTGTQYVPAAGGPVTQTIATNPLNWQTTTVIQPERGLPIQITDQNNHVTSARYDPLGRLTMVWKPDRTQGLDTPSVSYAYTENGTDALTVATTRLVADGSTETSLQLYDYLGRLRQTQVPADGGGMIVTDTQYDAANRVQLVSNPYWVQDQTPQPTVYVPDVELDGQTKYTYDSMARTTLTQLYIKNRTDPLTTTTRFYGDHTDTTPPDGGTPTRTTTDAHGHMIELDQFAGPRPTDTPDAQTMYGYDGRGDLISITDSTNTATQNHWSWGYDLLGRKVTSSDPDTGSSSYTYDNGGNLLISLDQRLQKISYTYDALNRVTAEYKSANQVPGNLLATWSYDPTASSRGLPFQATRYVGGANGSQYVTTSTDYDSLGYPHTLSATIPAAQGPLAGTYARTLAYNPDGSLRSTTYPAEGGLPAETVTNGYTVNGHLRKVTGGLSTYLQEARYSAIGDLSSIERDFANNSFQEQFGYETGTRRLNELKVLANTGTVADKTYSYDDIGDITEIDDQPSNQTRDTQCFSYDYLQRLTEAWTPASADCTASKTVAAMGGAAPYWQTYEYDATGNRTKLTNHRTSAPGATQSVVSYAYPASGSAQPHTLIGTTTTGSGAGSATYGYTAVGSLESVNGAVTNTYDAEGRLSATANASGNSSEIYAADGSRLIHTDSVDGTTLYLGDTELHLGVGQSTVTAVRTYSLGERPYLVRITDTSGAVSMIPVDADHQGTETDRINYSTLNPTRRYFDPFGNSRDLATVNWIINDQGFLGGSNDPVADTTHLGARELSADNGRFTTADPVVNASDPQQLNGYAYALNNPVSTSDPTGQMTMSPGAGGVCGAVGDCDIYQGISEQRWQHYAHPTTQYAPDTFKQIKKALTPKMGNAWDFVGGFASPLTNSLNFSPVALFVKNPAQKVDKLLGFDTTTVAFEAGSVVVTTALLFAGPAVGSSAGVGAVGADVAGAAATAGADSAIAASAAADAAGVSAAVADGSSAAADGSSAVDGAAAANRAAVSEDAGMQAPAGVGKGWQERVADNGEGVVWQEPGATGNANSVRIMNSNARYPNGYVRFYNDHGQPIDLNGKPGTRADTHIPRQSDGSYPIPKGW